MSFLLLSCMVEQDRNGWVSVHRKIQKKGWYRRSDYVHLWLHLIMKANHKGREFFWNNETIKLKRGQFVTGRKALSDETGISESKVQRILKCFENEQQIEQQNTNKFRLITVKNYDEYQRSEQQIEQQVNNKRTTSEQQVNTNNNNNNDNNDNNKGKIYNFENPKKTQYRDFDQFRLNDGTIARMRFGVWCGDGEPWPKIDRGYYKECPPNNI